MTHDLTRETLVMLERELGENCAAHWNPPEQKALAHAAECVRSVAALRRQVEELTFERDSARDGNRPLAEEVARRAMVEQELRKKAEIVDAMERGEIAAFSYRKDGRVALYTERCLREYEDEPIVAPTLVAAYAQARAAQEGRMADALPCPFCGSKMRPTTTLTDGYKWGALQCPECSASGPEVRTGYGTPETWYDDALVEWNKRPTPEQPDE